MKMSIEFESERRITLKRTRPNPLFQEWLEELYNEAKERKSKLEPMLKEALDSISKYPAPLKTGADCIILKGFQKKLCQHIDARLAVYYSNLAVAQSSTTSTFSSHSNGTASPSSDVIHIGTYLQPQNDNLSSSEATNQIKKATNKKSSSNENNLASNSQNNPTLDIQLPTVSNSEINSEPISCTNKQRTNKNYKPVFRSGPYAILRTLLEQHTSNPSESSLTKEALIDKAQIYCDESFVRPKPDTFYTAWSSMPRLETKGLVERVGVAKNTKFKLTEEGIQLARGMLKDYMNMPTDNDIIFRNAQPSCSFGEDKDRNIENDDNETASSQSAQKVDDTVIEFEPSSFDIILLIDKNETGGVSKKSDPTVAQFNKYYDLNHEYRNLKVGDFTWIARHQIHKDQELVLPYIVERKRMDDLGASIKDGRFHEQKFRLRKCGIPNVIYLVENYGKNKHVGLPIQNLQQALANTRVQDGFKVHITDSLRNSARFLTMMTRRLTIRFKDKALKGRNVDADDEHLMIFDYFNKASVKTKVLTVTETFIKLLLQLKGVSVEKALAITAKYSTPKSLIIAYQKCDPNEGKVLLANLKYGTVGRNVGPVASRSIYQLFSTIDAE